MKNIVTFWAALVLMTLLLSPAMAQTQLTDEDQKSVAILKLVIKQLRLEVIEQSIEFHNLKIRLLETEYEEVHRSQLEVEAQDQGLRQRLANLNASAADEAENGEAAHFREALSDKGIKKISDRLQSLQQREEELRRLLDGELKRRQELEERTKKINSEVLENR